MKNILIILTALIFQSCCIGARDSGPVLLDAADRAFNPYHLGDSFQMKDSKTGNEYWFKVKSRTMSAAQMHSGHKECETQLHTQKEETMLETDSFPGLMMTFTKGDQNVTSRFNILGYEFDLTPAKRIDSMMVLGQTYYQVFRGVNPVVDRSYQPTPHQILDIFYTQKNGIIQITLSDPATMDLVK